MSQDSTSENVHQLPSSKKRRGVGHFVASGAELRILPGKKVQPKTVEYGDVVIHSDLPTTG